VIEYLASECDRLAAKINAVASADDDERTVSRSDAQQSPQTAMARLRLQVRHQLTHTHLHTQTQMHTFIHTDAPTYTHVHTVTSHRYQFLSLLKERAVLTGTLDRLRVEMMNVQVRTSLRSTLLEQYKPRHVIPCYAILCSAVATTLPFLRTFISLLIVWIAFLIRLKYVTLQ
jgi:hypothetical protein